MNFTICFQFPVCRSKSMPYYSPSNTRKLFCALVMPCAFARHLFANGTIFFLLIPNFLLLKCTAQAHLCHIPLWNCPSRVGYSFVEILLHLVQYIRHAIICFPEVSLLILSCGRAAACSVIETYTSVYLLYDQKKKPPWMLQISVCLEYSVTLLVVTPDNTLSSLFDKPTLWLPSGTRAARESQAHALIVDTDKIDACPFIMH